MPPPWTLLSPRWGETTLIMTPGTRSSTPFRSKKTKKSLNLKLIFKKSLRKYSDFYLDPPCSQKLPGQKSSQRLFPQTKTMTKYFCNHTGKTSELCVNPEESCAYSEIAKTVCLIHLMSILELSVSRSASQKCELDSLQPRCA